jgi:hypothetical protein
VGTRRLQENFLAEHRTLGFIVNPGVPKTTAVSQETDQNYTPFNTHKVCEKSNAIVGH